MKCKPVLTRIILSLVLPCTFAAGCTNCSESVAHNMPDPAIKEVALHDADVIVSSSDNLQALENALLDAKAKETYMRVHGLQATANLYIFTIESRLRSTNPALAAKIGI